MEFSFDLLPADYFICDCCKDEVDDYYKQHETLDGDVICEFCVNENPDQFDLVEELEELEGVAA